MRIYIYIKLSNLKDYGFKDQVTRYCLSIPSNISEGFERESPKDCVKFLLYAKGSCGELRTQIYIGMDISYIDTALGKRWVPETDELSNMIGGLIKTKRSFLKGGRADAYD